MSDSDRRFWLVMTYACDKCGHEVEFYLEEGCEGPREKQVPTPAIFTEGPFTRDPGRLVRATGPATAAGRMVVPVPFVGAACPECQPGPPPWHPGKGVLQHVRWSEDRELEQRVAYDEVPAEAAVFLYPEDAGQDPNACGMPYLPGRRGEP